MSVGEEMNKRKKYEKSNLYNDINKVTEKLADAGIAVFFQGQLL